MMIDRHVNQIEKEDRLRGIYVALVLAVVSFTLAVSFSYTYWGYFFARPGLPSRTYTISVIKRIVPIETVTNTASQRTFKVSKDIDIGQSLSYCNKNDYYCLYRRILLNFKQRGILPDKYVYDLSGLPDITYLLNSSHLKVISDEGYESDKHMRGIVVEANDSDGKNLIYLSLIGGAVSNDHHPFYEAIFEKTDPQNIRYIDGNRFFYDFAGIEYLEWYIVWPALFAIGLFTFLPVLIILSFFINLYGKMRCTIKPWMSV